ncbi:16S rRNA (uracil(1498)-N(3))-methyltransferase [Sulfurimonas sp. C5]|uniref:16S rRNA (uracil(1498)-N(3))-methyltransferase n=1 Tax=Sulfurimonas sp. C5 TaxID=3036947 RepID=UPI002455A37C|nr:16S rRNA (uracil(1498)-N(3))-methyltransferase [Sulfurimonas sp. C5]MDH4944451.1 16S rRNA (uracil(1498)-N(3))-methyltransferase [Sulfurimonas sp. C5]
MIFIYEENASRERFTIKGELHKYLIKVRRHQEGDEISMRLKNAPEMLYTYKIVSVDPRSLEVALVSEQVCEVKAKKALHIGWCVIDTKSVEKVLPSLNEIGVEKITFIYCDRSQKNFKPDYKRYERILEASNQQCGRTDFMEFATAKNVQEFVEGNPDTKVFDFCENVLKEDAEISTVLIGCEGGFSKEEKELLSKYEVFRLDTPLVLRSESAVLAVASKIIL